MALAHCIQQGHMPMDLHEANPARFPNQFNSVKFLTERIPEVLGKHYEISYPSRQWSSGRNLKTSVLHEALYPRTSPLRSDFRLGASALFRKAIRTGTIFRKTGLVFERGSGGSRGPRKCSDIRSVNIRQNRCHWYGCLQISQPGLHQPDEPTHRSSHLYHDAQ